MAYHFVLCFYLQTLKDYIKNEGDIYENYRERVEVK